MSLRAQRIRATPTSAVAPALTTVTGATRTPRPRPARPWARWTPRRTTRCRWPSGAMGTKGGPRTDRDGRVLHVSGAVIPGLYAAGNAMAGVTGRAYGGAGGTIGPAMVFGLPRRASRRDRPQRRDRRKGLNHSNFRARTCVWALLREEEPRPPWRSSPRPARASSPVRVRPCCGPAATSVAAIFIPAYRHHQVLAQRCGRRDR